MSSDAQQLKITNVLGEESGIQCHLMHTIKGALRVSSGETDFERTTIEGRHQNLVLGRPLIPTTRRGQWTPSASLLDALSNKSTLHD